MKIPETMVPQEKVEVTIPQFDLFNNPMQPIRINTDNFEGGKTYLVNPDIAGEIDLLLTRFKDSQIRLLQPNKDKRAISDLEKWSGNSKGAYEK